MTLNLMLNLAPYDVVIWHRVHSSPADLHERIIARAGRQPDEGMEMEGCCDMHWGFQTAEEATTFAESMFELAVSDDLLVLTVLARRDERFGRQVFKDTRSSLQHPA